jgi:hypothetical protein
MLARPDLQYNIFMFISGTPMKFINLQKRNLIGIEKCVHHFRGKRDPVWSKDRVK